MKIVNGLFFGILFIPFLIWFLSLKKEDKALGKYTLFIKKHIKIFVLLFTVNTISFCLNFSKGEDRIIVKRDGYAGVEQEIDILLKKGNTTENITLNVKPRQLTPEQKEEKEKEAFAYFDKHLKGENESLLKVNRNLDFSLDYKKYPFDTEFQLKDYALIDGEGNVKNSKEELAALGYQQKDLEEGIATEVTVILWYGEKSSRKSYTVLVFPREENSVQKQFSNVKEEIYAEEKKALYEEYFELPNCFNDVQITRTDVNKITPFHVLLIGFSFAGLLIIREKEKIKDQERKRQEMLRRSYPWFVNELVLLLGAGMQVKNIFAILIDEYEQNTKQKIKLQDYRNVLVQELKWSKHSLALGVSEEQVYYQLGRRLKLPCYIKLMTLLEQNVKRGTKGLTAIFEQEELNALEERKNLARRYGEEAGTKLLGPMILLLLVIMLMIMVPAFLSFY